MSGRAVVCYDLSGRAGYAVYSPDLPDPVFGVVNLPPTTVEGSVGPAFKLLYDHISWVDKRWPLGHIGYEAFIAPTGGKRDDDKGFVTSPATMKKQIGLIAVVELCAAILDLHPESINNSSWRKYWLGGQKRGTPRDVWKELSKAKAKSLGWDVKGDDDADALGQLHFLLNKHGIRPDWGRDPTRAQVNLNWMRGVPIGV